MEEIHLHKKKLSSPSSSFSSNANKEQMISIGRSNSIVPTTTGLLKPPEISANKLSITTKSNNLARSSRIALSKSTPGIRISQRLLNIARQKNENNKAFGILETKASHDIKSSRISIPKHSVFETPKLEKEIIKLTLGSSNKKMKERKNKIRKKKVSNTNTYELRSRSRANKQSSFSSPSPEQIIPPNLPPSISPYYTTGHKKNEHNIFQKLLSPDQTSNSSSISSSLNQNSRNALNFKQKSLPPPLEKPVASTTHQISSEPKPKAPPPLSSKPDKENIFSNLIIATEHKNQSDDDHTDNAENKEKTSKRSRKEKRNDVKVKKESSIPQDNQVQIDEQLKLIFNQEKRTENEDKLVSTVWKFIVEATEIYKKDVPPTNAAFFLAMRLRTLTRIVERYLVLQARFGAALDGNRFANKYEGCTKKLAVRYITDFFERIKN